VSTAVTDLPPSDMSMERNELFDEASLALGPSRVGGGAVEGSVEMTRRVGDEDERGGIVGSGGPRADVNGSEDSRGPRPNDANKSSRRVREESIAVDTSSSAASSADEGQRTLSSTTHRMSSPGNNFWDGILSPSDQQPHPPPKERTTPPRGSREVSRRPEVSPSTQGSSSPALSSSSEGVEDTSAGATPTRNYWDGILDEVDGSDGEKANLVSLRQQTGAGSTGTTPMRQSPPPPPPPLPEERPREEVSRTTGARQAEFEQLDESSGGSEEDSAQEPKSK
jgi:hypothetical protein